MVTSRGIMVSSEFDSHWAPHDPSLKPHLSLMNNYNDNKNFEKL